MSEIKRGKCHCGSVEFQVELENGFEELRRCNCSICKRRQNIVASVPLDKFKVTKGSDKLSRYKFNTKTAEHFFCSVCGIYTHHKRRSNRGQYGFNIACIEDVNPYDYEPVNIVDGASNHPSDSTNCSS